MDTTMLIFGVVTLVIIVLVVVIYFLVIKKKSKNETPVPQPKPSPAPQPKPIPQVSQREVEDSYKEPTIEDFYNNFSSFNNDIKTIIFELSKYDYEKMDHGRLKDFLEHHGLGFEKVDKIMDGIYQNYKNKIESHTLEEDIENYKQLGWDDEKIKDHFYKNGYNPDRITDAFKEYHKKMIYDNYVKDLIEHIKPFLLAGNTDREVIDKFKQHNWPEPLIREALQKAKDVLEKENSSLFLEEEILKLILSGENKEHIAKILTKKGWPEDGLKEHYDDLEKGIEHLQKSLEEVDLNQYHIDAMKKSLKDKNWPDEIIERTINNVVQKVEYHRKLDMVKNEVMALVNQGKNSIEIQNKLRSEGWDENIIKKIIHKINKRLSEEGDKEKIKSFNNHVFVKDNWHEHIHNGFDSFEVNEQKQNNSPEKKDSSEKNDNNSDDNTKKSAADTPNSKNSISNDDNDNKNNQVSSAISDLKSIVE